MAPRARLVGLQHRVRLAHPLRPGMVRSLHHMDHADPGTIRRYQERRLRALVRWAAARSPFYRDWFARSHVDPRRIRGLDDLAQLPLLDRSILAEDPDRFRAYPRRLMWIAHSSGTSGHVITTYRTPGSSAFELAALERQWGWFGLPQHPRRVVLRGGDPDPHGQGVLTRSVPGSHQLVVSSYRLGTTDLDELLAEIGAFAPAAVEGWPSSLTLLASLLDERGERLPVRAVITSSEVTTPRQAALWNQVFEGPIVDHYGQTERVTMAGTCEVGGYHLFPDYAITELLPVEGRSECFEVVGTPLHNWGFPLFRYRTGDEVGPAPKGACSCGRAFPLMGRVDGRLEDDFTAADGRLLPMPSLVTTDLVGLREVQVAQLAPGMFEFRMVPGPSTDLRAVQEQARRNVERRFGPGQTVTFRTFDSIPRGASGKLRSTTVDSPR